MASLHEDIIGGLGRGGVGMGGGDGGGGMLMGLILGTLLRGNNGLLGGGASEAGGVNNLQATIDTNSILTQLADIKAAVPYNEAQMQLALAGVQASISSQASANTQYLSQGQTAIQLAQQATAAALARDIASVDTNVDRQATAIQIAVSADGDKTRALITSNQIADLNQRLTVAQLEASELRVDNRSERDRHGVEITMTNNQNQNQLQFQQQAQTQNILLNALASLTQNIRSTNEAINIGGFQSASPTNTNTNVAR